MPRTTDATADRSGLLVFAATALACAACVPITVNGDGLGYLRAAIHGATVPGHLAYLPLLRAIARIVSASTPQTLLPSATALSILSAATAAALVAATTYRLLQARRAALIAGLGFAASFGLVQAGSDVETYAPALAALCLSMYCGARRSLGGSAIWLCACALMAAAATLLHIENAFFVPTAALLCGRRSPWVQGSTPGTPKLLVLADAIVVLAIAGLAVLAAYAAVAHARGDDLAAALRFVRGSSHGFSYPLRPWTPFVAVYGIAKTLVYAPYPYEAGWLPVVAQAAAGICAAWALTYLATRPARPATFGPWATASWVIPYAFVGVTYFASDNERWLFLLPLAWISAAAGASTSPRALRAATVLVALLGLGSVALGHSLATVRAARERADAVGNAIHDGDLLVSPGHGWDEYVGFYLPRNIDRFPIVYYCGQLGGVAPARARLGEMIARTRRAGAQVYFARADEGADTDGWKDLALFGLAPSGLDAFLLPGRRVHVAAGLDRVDGE